MASIKHEEIHEFIHMRQGHTFPPERSNPSLFIDAGAEAQNLRQSRRQVDPGIVPTLLHLCRHLVTQSAATLRSAFATQIKRTITITTHTSSPNPLPFIMFYFVGPVAVT